MYAKPQPKKSGSSTRAIRRAASPAVSSPAEISGSVTAATLSRWNSASEVPGLTTSSSASASTSSRSNRRIWRRIARPCHSDPSERPHARPGDAWPRPVEVAHPHAEVGFFHQQPAAGSEPGDHPPERGHPVRDVHEQRAPVHQVERAGGNSSVRTSWRSTSRFGSESSARKPVSRSVAVTRPSGPTCSHSQRATDPRPPPTSRQRAPGARPSRPTLRCVSGSRRSANRSRRRPSWAPVCGNAYSAETSAICLTLIHARAARPAQSSHPWRPWGLAVKAKHEDCYNATNAPR